MKLNDKVAVVTGGGSGIGRATALLFAQERAKVVVADIAPDGGQETVQQIREKGGDAVFTRADVTRAADVQQAVQTAVDHYGTLDILHNNAGVEGKRTRTQNLSEETWDKLIAINLKSIFLGCKYAIPQMLEQGSGVIINTASIAGITGIVQLAAYCAAKGGAIMLTRSVALEYAKKNIRVNCICPGGVKTPMFDESVGVHVEKAEKLFQTQWPLGRYGLPQEIAQAALFLASDESSYMTGATLVVDGGWTAQ